MDDVRLIDRNALKSELCSGCGTHDACVTVCRAIRVINRQPTIDAEPVVRCGECKYMKPDGHCTMFADDHIRPSVSDHCSAGERMDGGAENGL